MTVAEYIAALQQLPQEAEVYEYDGTGGFIRAGVAELRPLHPYMYNLAYRCQGQIDATSLQGTHAINGCFLCAEGIPLVQVVVL